MDISINYTSGEICFSSSSQSCELTRLTRYNVSILDLSENEIFSGEDIAESTCVAINELMHPDHAPFVISAQAFNDYIEYNSVKQLITSGIFWLVTRIISLNSYGNLYTSHELFEKL